MAKETSKERWLSAGLVARRIGRSESFVRNIAKRELAADQILDTESRRGTTMHLYANSAIPVFEAASERAKAGKGETKTPVTPPTNVANMLNVALLNVNLKALSAKVERLTDVIEKAWLQNAAEPAKGPRPSDGDAEQAPDAVSSGRELLHR